MELAATKHMRALLGSVEDLKYNVKRNWKTASLVASFTDWSAGAFFAFLFLGEASNGQKRKDYGKASLPAINAFLFVLPTSRYQRWEGGVGKGGKGLALLFRFLLVEKWLFFFYSSKSMISRDKRNE